MSDEKVRTTAQWHAAIDAEFIPMAVDCEYQREAAELAEDFQFADWEAFALVEGES